MAVVGAHSVALQLGGDGGNTAAEKGLKKIWGKIYELLSGWGGGYGLYVLLPCFLLFMEWGGLYSR